MITKVNKIFIFILFILCLFFMIFIYKINHYPVVIDVHGCDMATENKIKNSYRWRASQLAWLIKEHVFVSDQLKDKLVLKTSKYLIHEIKRNYHLLDVHLSPILYPDDSSVYLTVDLVSSHLLPTLNHHGNQSIPDPDNLIKLWGDYEALGYAYFRKHGRFPFYQVCPANHCLFGFDMPNFKYYLSVFSKSVSKNKRELIRVIKEDKDEYKRANSIFLLAHLKDAREVILALLPSMYDESALVRNNALRVIGFILIENKDIHLSVEPFRKILQFPLTTDRNKGLLVLLGLSEHVKCRDKMVQYFGADLYGELRQRQPNVHYLAYEILKKLSGENYKDTDFQSWEDWLESRHVSVKK